MRYNRTVEARFVSRPNRFIAQVELDGKIETVHVKNTGRCKELLLPNSRVILSEAENPARKTRCDLIAVEKVGLWLVNIDSQVPNKVMAEWLAGQYQNSVLNTIAPLGAVLEAPCYKGLRGFCFFGHNAL